VAFAPEEHPDHERRRPREHRSTLVSTPNRRGPGNDPRIVSFRGALESLLESLDATVRIARWQPGGEEPIPEPLQKSAAQLVQRLGTARRLASGRFVGAPGVVASSDAIRKSILDLDAAYVAYHKRVESHLADGGEAAIALDSELGRVKIDAHRWE
jgi:hypothetical protein